LKFSMQNSIFVSTSMVNASLVTSILADPHQLVPVDTIEKAARWGIGIGGIKSHWDLTPRTLVQACTNYENWTVDQASTTLKPEDSVDDLKPAGFASGDDEKAFYYWDSGGYADRGCYIAVRNGEGANALDICLVNDFKGINHGDCPEYGDYAPAYYGLPPDTRIADLPPGK